MTRNVAIDTNTHRYDEPVKLSSYSTDVMEPDRGPDTSRVTRESRTITPTEECEWSGVYVKTRGLSA